MFSDDYNFANPKLASNSSSNLKVIEKTPYPGVNRAGHLGNCLQNIKIMGFLILNVTIQQREG